tara:strand:+ start:2142 stop:3866 length:1725 start_codon:yes stop_codon:yes gene_type:complete
MALDDFFESVDTDSSFERGVDAYGNEFTERWNDMPEVGGTLRQKGKVASSLALLEQLTGTTPRPSKNGEVANEMPTVDGSTQNILAPSSLSQIRNRISRNRTDMQEVSGPDALEVGRDGNLYRGYNLRNAGVFRNNGREQTRGMQTNERMGMKTVRDTLATSGGQQEAPHKSGNVDLSSAAGRGVQGRPVELTTASIRFTGRDASVARSGNKFVKSDPLAPSAVAIGERDSHRATSARRVTNATRLQADAGHASVARWDSTASVRTAPRDTYSRYAASKPAHSLSQWDSVGTHGLGGRGEPTSRSYAQTSLIASSNVDLSREDSVRNVREGAAEYVQARASSGRIARAHRSDARVASGPPASQAWRQGAPAVEGERATDRRFGAYRPVAPDVGRAPATVPSTQGRVPPVRKRPESALRTSGRDAERYAATAGAHHLNTDEGGRTVQAPMRARFAEISALIRTAVFGGTTRQTRSSVARTGNQTGVGSVSLPGKNTRKTPDDSVERCRSPSKTGRSAHVVGGLAAGITDDRSLLPDMMRGQLPGAPSTNTPLSDVRSTRGMSLVEDEHMERSNRA